MRKKMSNDIANDVRRIVWAEGQVRDLRLTYQGGGVLYKYLRDFETQCFDRIREACKEDYNKDHIVSSDEIKRDFENYCQKEQERINAIN
jgi:hypothetical protein